MNSPAVSIASKASTVIVVCSRWPAGGPAALAVQPAASRSELVTVTNRTLERGIDMAEPRVLPGESNVGSDRAGAMVRSAARRLMHRAFFRRPPGFADIKREQPLVRADAGGRAGQRDPASFQDRDAIGQGQAPLDVLLDD